MCQTDRHTDTAFLGLLSEPIIIVKPMSNWDYICEAYCPSAINYHPLSNVSWTWIIYIERMSSVLESIQLCPLDIPKGLTLSATALTFSGKGRELWLVIGGERELWLVRGGERELWLVRGGEREPGDPAARVIDPPGDRQRDQAAPGQAQEEHQEHVRVRVISHDGLDYVSLTNICRLYPSKIWWKYNKNTIK